MRKQTQNFSSVCFFVKLRGKEAFIFVKDIACKFFFNVEPALNALHFLINGKIKKIVNGDAKLTRKGGQERDVGHRHTRLPFGNRLRADAKTVGKLFLRESRAGAELLDLVCNIHKISPSK